MAKTNAARLLDELSVTYRLLEYDVSDEHVDAAEVASKVGLAPEQVFKTLVARGDRHGVVLAVVSAASEVDLKALARVRGDRQCELVHLREVQPLTGYVRGGVTALACRKPYPVVLDELAELSDEISVSAGQRGLQIVLHPRDYVRATGAVVAAIARDRS